VGEQQVQKRVMADGIAKASSQPDAEVKKAKTPAEAAAAYFPNTTLLTQDNKPVRFFDDLLKGKVVIINFMFTTCTGVCPPMTANLAKVQDYLGERVGRDVNIISISVDPRTGIIRGLEELQNYATDVIAPVTFGPNRRTGASCSYIVKIDLNKSNMFRSATG
jgi:cytochrome oxidase Cu insertion factor (SCO1/SenC/PrrC family)